MAENEELVNITTTPAPAVTAAPVVEPKAPATEEPSVIAAYNEPLAEAHSDEDAPETTRHDATDMGVPMLPGSPNEPQGPEDALGPGPKRGDYTGRVGSANYQPHEVVLNEAGQVEVVAQRPRTEDIADAPGKGGVTTAQ